MTREEKVYKEAKLHNICAMMNGTENTEDLIKLFFTPQGIEFCTKYNSPSLHTFRSFKGLQATRGGFYIDTPVKAKNIPRLALIGSETIADIEFTEPERFEVVLMHGAKARITASGYAVVSVRNSGCEVEIIQKDNSVIFQ